MQSQRELPPLLLRADAGAVAGTGHVMRCLAIAQAWRNRGGSVLFATYQAGASLYSRMTAAGAELVILDRQCPASEDAGQTIQLVERLAQRHQTRPWLAVDGYHFNLEYQHALRTASCYRLLIDDNAHLAHYDADIILNHGIQAPRLSYTAGPDTWLLLGTRYALLRPEFDRWRGRARRQPMRAKKILVTLGGADHHEVTVKVIEALRRFNPLDIEAQVVVGPLYSNLDELRRRLAANTNIRLHTNPNEIAPLMAWADVAIAAAGTTAWELAFMQTPALLLVLADNQCAVARGIDEFGAARSLGWSRQIAAAEIFTALSDLLNDENLRARMAERGRTMVDGRGIERVTTAMMERRNFRVEENLRFRAATSDDRLLLWQWANDPPTRLNSFSPAPISWADHETWYAGRIAAPDCRIWIMQIGEMPVGQIRYDRSAARGAEISFAVAPGFRGKGLGSKMLLATAPLATAALAVDWLEGVAFDGNKSSQKAFRRAGFDLVEQKLLNGRACAVFRRAAAKQEELEHHAAVH